MDFPTKQCIACKAIKPLSEFPHSFNWGKSRPRSRCQPCYLEYQGARRAAKRAANPPVEKPTKTHHTCTRCGETKPLSEFGVGTRRNGHEYPRPQCKSCYREMGRKPRSEQKIRRVYTDPLTGDRMKQCARCEKELPVSLFAVVSGRVRSYCKECETNYNHELYWRDPERARAAARLDYERHTDERLQRAREWREANREWVENYQREYNEQHLEQKAAYTQRRRAEALGAPVVEEVDRVAIIQRDKSTCYLCGKLLGRREITLDHVIPLSRGGSHTAENLRVCCHTCNVRKKDRLLEELAS